MTNEAQILSKMINEAIANMELSTTDYEKIMAQAHLDGKIDPEERELLRKLITLIGKGVIKRVNG